MSPRLLPLAVLVATLGLSILSPAQAGSVWTKVAMPVSTCPLGYVQVPASALPDGTVVPQFCVMKYEAKQNTTAYGSRAIGGNVGALPISTAAGAPWGNLTWQDARSACAASGAQLITENQWLSIANQVTTVASNWSSGIVGNGFLFSGHNDVAPAAPLEASTNDADGYFGTGDSAISPGDGAFQNFSSNVAQAYQGQRRTLTLPNGQVVWDLAGNISEWTDATIVATSRYHGGASSWMSYNSTDGWTVASNVPLAKRPPLGYNANHGMGWYYDGVSTVGAYNSVSEAPDNCTGYCGSVAAFLRGGHYNYGPGTGVFTLILNVALSYVDPDVGFRCSR